MLFAFWGFTICCSSLSVNELVYRTILHFCRQSYYPVNWPLVHITRVFEYLAIRFGCVTISRALTIPFLRYPLRLHDHVWLKDCTVSFTWYFTSNYLTVYIYRHILLPEPRLRRNTILITHSIIYTSSKSLFNMKPVPSQSLLKRENNHAFQDKLLRNFLFGLCKPSSLPASPCSFPRFPCPWCPNPKLPISPIPQSTL